VVGEIGWVGCSFCVGGEVVLGEVAALLLVWSALLCARMTVALLHVMV
jgi:hypothetical protein